MCVVCGVGGGSGELEDFGAEVQEDDGEVIEYASSVGGGFDDLEELRRRTLTTATR